MLCARLLAYVTGTVNQELLLRNEYLAAENRILKAQIKGRLLLTQEEKVTLAEIARRLGRKALEEVASTAQPDTILGWYRRLIANKFNGSRFRKRVGRPRVAEEIERLVLRMAKENPSWGYDRIVGALANLGHRLSDQTVGNVLRRHGLSPAPKRKQTVSWKAFIRSHRDVLVGMDFFTTEVLTLTGLLTYYVLFFIHLETRRVRLAGFTPYPDQDWMEQQARNMTMEEWGCLRGCRYVLHDRDTKFCESFCELIESGNVKPIRLPARSPNLNSYAERWVRSVKEECLSRLILVGESSLRRALQQYIVHYHEERNHQGKDNRILFPSQTEARRNPGAVRCRERLGGLLKYYEREAA
ncbi:MAG TPA: helix-turn-helix domain-containing protein [Candidatus Bathyarchaeia archaeon]|nr:helix-turn-helix domain-containing protein [Candidatus Bathyarchaeia archaeon]